MHLRRLLKLAPKCHTDESHSSCTEALSARTNITQVSVGAGCPSRQLAGSVTSVSPRKIRRVLKSVLRVVAAVGHTEFMNTATVVRLRLSAPRQRMSRMRL